MLIVFCFCIAFKKELWCDFRPNFKDVIIDSEYDLCKKVHGNCLKLLELRDPACWRRYVRLCTKGWCHDSKGSKTLFMTLKFHVWERLICPTMIQLNFYFFWHVDCVAQLVRWRLLKHFEELSQCTATEWKGDCGRIYSTRRSIRVECIKACFHPRHHHVYHKCGLGIVFWLVKNILN